MRFFRVIAYVVACVATITVWESCKDQVKSVFATISTGALTNIESNQERKDNESDKKGESNVAAQSPTLAKKSQTELTPESQKKSQTVKKPVSSSDSAVVNFEEGFASVAKKVMPSVVNVATMQIIKEEVPDIMGGFFGRESPFGDIFKDFFGDHSSRERSRKTTSLGSGFIVKVDPVANKAYIVTNNHVVEKAKKIVIYLADKTELTAELHAADSRTDIAVLVVDTKILGEGVDSIKAVEWGDSDELEEGNWVVAIGNPFGLGGTVTHGIVSGKGRSIGVPGKTSLSFVNDFIQHSAQINMGNSGGCLIDVHGKVVGVNNAIFSTSGGNIGIGFAIPSNIVQNTVDQLIEHKRTYRGWFGAEIQPITEKQAESVGLPVERSLDPSKICGAFVTRVVPGGPAEVAGIKRGDIILEFDGQKISEKNSLTKIVGFTKINSEVPVKIWRKTEEQKREYVILKVKVGDFEKAIKTGCLDSPEVARAKNGKQSVEEIPELGIALANDVPEQVKNSIPSEFASCPVVVKVDDTQSFFESLFLPGDVIVSVNDCAVKNAKDIMKILKAIPKGKLVSFIVIRGGVMVMIAVTPDYDAKPKKSKKDPKEKGTESDSESEQSDSEDEQSDSESEQSD
jgi:serine protease Do